MENTFNIDAIKAFLNTFSDKAKALLLDNEKLEIELQKLEKKLSAVPVVGTTLAYVPIMISMVRMYAKKEYTDVPSGTIAATLGTLIYVLSPIDLIPDFLPGGLADDALVVAGCFILIRSDLEDYRKWRAENGYTAEDIPDYEDLKKQADAVNSFFHQKNKAEN